MKRVLSSFLSIMIASTAFAESPTIVDKQLEVGLKLLKLSPNRANSVLSPFGVHVGLVLARFGARGATAEDIDRLLFGAELNGDIEGRYATLCDQVITSAGDGVSASVANSIWIASQSTPRSEFVSKAKRLKADVSSIDFADSERAREKINSWISEKTARLIPEILKPGSLSARTTAALVNALYFKAAWQEPFAKIGTHEEPFYIDGGDQAKNVPMMFTTSALPFYNSNGWQVVTLPYKSGRYDLLVFVPEKRLSTSEVVKSLTASHIQKAILLSSESEVELSLPRFSVRQSQDIAKASRDLGISILFSDRADLSAISETPTLISTAPHEAVISVDEEGTEAAASTAMIGVLFKASDGGGPKVVRADHPFAFVIIHRASRAPLFLGVVGDPRG